MLLNVTFLLLFSESLFNDFMREVLLLRNITVTDKSILCTEIKSQVANNKYLYMKIKSLKCYSVKQDILKFPV